MSLRGWASFATLAFGALTACGSLHADSSGDPCTQLGIVCPYCTDSADQENCNDAVKAADEGQCAAILDTPSVQAHCVVTDGSAPRDATADAAPLPPCGTTATADAGCVCSSSTCGPSCAAGGCAFTCTSGTCSPSCAGGHCTLTCQSGATCEASCAGGDCVFDCKAGSTCANACPGGGCAFQCENGAVCNDTCGSATTCTGY